MQLDALTQALEGLRAAGPEAFADRDSIKQLHVLSTMFDAIVTEAVGVFDASRVWREDRAQTATQWLTGFCRVPKHVAGPRVNRARNLRDLPICAVAFAEGAITATHVDVIARLRRPATEQALAEGGEALLVDHARQVTFKQFDRYANHWAAEAAPTDADARAADQRDQREVFLRQGFEGMYFGRMYMDPIGGTVVFGELERLTLELYQADRAAARARLGRDPRPDELGRTPAQRRVDALEMMAVRSKSLDGPVADTPLFTAVVDFPTLGTICQLADGTPVTPGALASYIDGALLERAVWRAKDRVDISETSRFFVGATRRVVEVAHPDGCFEGFCDVPTDQGQIDHIVAVADGGRTTQGNGQPGCEFHNLLKENLRKHQRWLERRGDAQPGNDPPPDSNPGP